MNNTHSNSSCQPAEPYYYDYLSGNSDHIPESVSVHIADCPDCQNEIQWLTRVSIKSEEDSPKNTRAIAHAAQMQLHSVLIDQPVNCSTIRSFLPILAIPEMDVRISTPVTAHIQACAECAHDLETLKQLNLSSEQLSGLSQIFSRKQSENLGDTQTVTDAFFRGTSAKNTAIRGIMDRPDSGIVTTFHAEKSSESTEPLYHVETTNNRLVPETALRINPQKTSTRQPAVMPNRFRRFLKPIAAAAAVAIVGIFLFQSPSVKATDIGQIYEALKNVQNIIMTQYDVNIEDPVQTTHISRSLGVKLFETSGAFTLYDIKNKTQKMRADSVSEIQQADIDREMVRAIAGSMDVPWGLLPFKKDSDLPDGAVWEKVPPAQAGLSSEQTEIFDLFWSTETTGGKFDYQWRCHIDAATKRPFKVEWRQKNQLDREYELTTFTEISYPTENQIKEVIEQAGL